jgi:hypothetical protein
MTSSAPGGWSPYGGPVADEQPPAPRPESRRPPYVLATFVILEFFVIVGLAGWLYWKYHYDKTHPAGSVAGVKSLNHQAVEQYVTDRFQVTGVTCNDGANVPMTSNGATFPCTSRGGAQFVVTVTDKNTGDYTVRPVAPVQSATTQSHPPTHHKRSAHHHKKKH